MSLFSLENFKPELISTISRIQLVAFDFDGVFTDNSVYISQDGTESVKCTRSDGLGLRKLDEVNVRYLIISTETNPVVQKRADKLKIRCFHGCDDKVKKLKDVAHEYNIELENVAFVGNDINDSPCLNIVGLPIVVGDAYPEAAQYSIYQTARVGGDGAVREVCDLIHAVKLSNTQ